MGAPAAEVDSLVCRHLAPLSLHLDLGNCLLQVQGQSTQRSPWTLTC